MNKFPFPWALTAVHTLCGSIGAQIALQRGFYTPQSLSSRENLVLLAFSSLYTVNIAVSNLSLNLVTVPFHQVVRATTPLFAIALGALMLKKRTSRATLVSLMPVVLGVVFATQVRFEPRSGSADAEQRFSLIDTETTTLQRGV